MMLNYFPLNNANSRVWDGYNYHLYSSTTSYEKYSIHSQTILKEYQSKDDLLYKSSSYDFHDNISTCIDSPLDLSQGSTLFNGKKMIENVDTVQKYCESENGLEFKENPQGFDQYPIDLSKATTTYRRKLNKNYSMSSRISNSISDESSKPKVRRRILYCHYCPYFTNHKNDLRKHMYGVHFAANNVVCPRCGITSKHKYSLKVHLSYCGKEPRFYCAYCPYKSRKRHHLQKHALKHVKKNVIEEISVLPEASTLLPLSISPGNQNSNPPSSEIAKQLTIEEQPKFNLNVTPNVVALPIPVPLPLSRPLCNQNNNPPLSQKTEQKAVEEKPLFNVEVMPKASTLFPLPISPCNQNSDPPLKQKIEQKTAEEQPKLNIKECPVCGKVFKYWGLMQRHYKSCSENWIQCKYCPYKAKDSTMLEMHVFSVHPNISSEEALM